MPINNQTNQHGTVHGPGQGGMIQHPMPQQQMFPVFGPDGKPVLGPDGRPIMRGGMQPQMQPQMQPVVGPDGRFVMGPDGRPLMRQVGGPTMGQQHHGQQHHGQHPGGMIQQHQMPTSGGQGRPGGGLIQTNQVSPQPQQHTDASRLALQQQRFLNPTGQARFNAQQNPSLNIDPSKNTGGTYQDTQECWGKFCAGLATYFCCCCCEAPYKQVPQGYSGIIQRFGKYYKLVPAGFHYLNPELDQLVLVDKREQVYLLKKQVVQTKDNVTLTVDAILYYKIVDSYKSKFAVNDLVGAMKDLTETVLRSAIGKMSLQEVLQKKEALSEAIMKQITEPVFNWGVEVTRALIQDIIFGRNQQTSLAQGALAKKIAEAKVIQTQADVESARLMKEAASVLATEAAMQIRYLESLESISRSANPKFVFFPADFSEIGSSNI